jgi:hypothetical protein
MKNRQCLKIIKAMRFSHCPEIMENRQKVWKSWDFHIAQKSWKTDKNHEIFTLPRNHEKPSVFKNLDFFQKSWKTVKVFKNHKIFTLPRNHEKLSKCLKIMKAMRFSHCPEIMKNCQSVWKSWKQWDFHIAQKSWKTVKKFEIMKFSHCPEIMKNRQSV